MLDLRLRLKQQVPMKRLLVLFALVALLTGVSFVFVACAGGTGQMTTAGTGPPTDQSSGGSSETALLLTPVSGPPPPLPLGTPYPQTTGGRPTTTETGNGVIEGHLSYRGSPPRDQVLVTVFPPWGHASHSALATDSYVFDHLPPGCYRVMVNTQYTGYVSQYFGGLPCQGHALEESQSVEVGDGVTRADFLLEPGLSIRGRVTWSGAHRDRAWLFLFDESGAPVPDNVFMFRSADPDYLFVGLLPGGYKVVARADDPYGGPEVWYGGGGSFEAAAIVDLTTSDATGIDIDLGVLPETTIPRTTIPTSTTTASGLP